MGRLRNLDNKVLGEDAVYEGRGGLRGVNAPVAAVFPLVCLAGLSVLFGVRLDSLWYGIAFAAGCALMLAADRAVRGLWYWQRATRKPQ